MKIRTGFVSNSSSSSFVAILTKDDFNKIVDKLSPIAKVVATDYSEIDNEKLDDIDIITYSCISGNDGPDLLYEKEDKINFINKLLALVYDYDAEILVILQNIIEQIKSGFKRKPSGLGYYSDAECEVMSMYNDGLSEFQHALIDLNKNNKCIIVRQDW